ncbi:MAG: hypothetical protein WC946_11360 [Bacteroidales bacterium]
MNIRKNLLKYTEEPEQDQKQEPAWIEDVKSLDQLTNRTEYQIKKSDIFRLVTGSKGNGELTKRLRGSYGGCSGWSGSYEVLLQRGECDIIQQENSSDRFETVVETVLVPRSRYCVIVESSTYDDINGRVENVEYWHFFTVSSGWKTVPVHLS